MDLQRDNRKRKAVAGIIAAVIMFAIIFTVGLGFFLDINYFNQLSSAANGVRVSNQLAKQSESASVVALLNQTNQHLGGYVFNSGASSISIKGFYFIDQTGLKQVFVDLTRNPTIIGPQLSGPALFSGLACVNPTLAAPCIVKALTIQGNTISAQFPCVIATPGCPTGLPGPGGSTTITTIGGTTSTITTVIGGTTSTITTVIGGTTTTVSQTTSVITTQTGGLPPGVVEGAIAQNVGPFLINFGSFTFFCAGGCNPLGGGYNVNGYFGFNEPGSQRVIVQLVMTNFDPQQRGMTLSGSSLVQLNAGATEIYIAGSHLVNGTCYNSAYNPTCLSELSDDSYVAGIPYSPLTIKWDQGAVLNFAYNGSPCVVGSCVSLGVGVSNIATGNTFSTFLIMTGFYSDGTPFSQTIPFPASFTTSATDSACFLGQATSGTACPNAVIAGTTTQDLRLTPGSTYTFKVAWGASFASTATSVLWVVPPGISGGLHVSTNITVARNVGGGGCSSAACYISFKVPVGAAPGFYQITTMDGTNIAYATVAICDPTNHNIAVPSGNSANKVSCA